MRIQTRSWLFALLLVTLTAPPALATEWVVTDPGDTLPGGTTGQLRKAISDAVSGDVIVIQVTQPIVLAGGVEDNTNAEGDLDIVGKAITIQGGGPGVTIIDGGGLSRVFDVRLEAQLALSGVTVRGGATDAGAGIFNEGSLTLINVELTGNHATAGGGGVFNNGEL